MEKEYLKSEWYFMWKEIFMRETYTWLKNRRFSVYREGDRDVIDAFEVAFKLAEKSKGRRRKVASNLRTVATHGVL